MDESKNTNVYVSGYQMKHLKFITCKLSGRWNSHKSIIVIHIGLPEETTEEEFIELMSKYGIIMEDNDTS